MWHRWPIIGRQGWERGGFAAASAETARRMPGPLHGRRPLARRHTMSTIMIKCPQTGLAVSTGIEVERDTFVALPDAEAQMLCPACGGDHIWSKGQAWLADDDGARPT
jgi:hypothetical protein